MIYTKVIYVYIKYFQLFEGSINMKVKTLNGNLNIVGNNLRKYREIKKISQPEICRKLDLLGVTMYNCDIYEIEYGKKTVKDFEALAFCKVLGISLEDLYYDTDKYYEA